MRSLIRWAIDNSPAMNTLLIGLMVLGAASMAMMRREVFPEFELEILLVSVPYPGARPEEVEKGICQKIEEAVQGIDGIKKQTAVAQENAGFVVLELRTDVDVQKVLNEVRSEIDQIPSFPDLAEDPDVQQITFRFPAIRIGVLGPNRDDQESDLALREIAEQVRSDILQLQAAPPSDLFGMILSKIRPRASKSVVSSANILGAKPYQIDIEIQEKTLREYDLSLREVAEIVRRQNIELPGGRMKTDAQEMLVVGKNKQVLGEQIQDVVIVTQPNGDKLTIADLGNVRDGFADDTLVTRIDGRPGIAIQVDRTSSEDLLEVVASVEHYAKTKSLPPDYELKLWYDQAVDVRDRMNMLLRNGLQGLVLVFIVLAVFLEIRLAFWVALGIPVAVLGAGGYLLYADQTLNMLSMFAFLMALGIVVDDAIVIGENIYHHRNLGKNFVRAAIDGTNEVLPSVVASVSTTMIAFAPLMFVAGVMGKFIGVMPVAVLAMLVISLAESTFILPCHLSHHDNLFFKILGVILYPLKFMLKVFSWLNEVAARWLDWAIHRAYIPSLRWSIHNPSIVLSAAVCLLILAAGFVQSGITPFVVFPKLDNRFIEAVAKFPNGTPADVSAAAAERLEQAIEKVNERYAAEMKEEYPNKTADQLKLIRVRHRTVGQILEPDAQNPTGTMTGSHLGAVMVELVSPSERQVKSQKVLDWWREEAGEFPGAESVTFKSPSFGPASIPIEFKLLAENGKEDQLEPAAELCKTKLREFKGVFDVDDDSTPGKWELQLKVKDESHGMNVTLADLAQTVRSSFHGEEVMRLQRGRHEVKLMVRYPPNERASLAKFEEIRIRGQDRAERPVTEVAEINYDRGPSEINRINQLRSITVMADVDESQANARDIVESLQSVEPSTFEKLKSYVTGWLGIKQPDPSEVALVDEVEAKFPGIHIRWEGQQEQTQESMQSLLVGFIIAMLAMFVLLTVEFRSYFQPLLILAIIPFGAIGAVGGHALFGMDLTLFSVFGLIALTGVIVNDSIVLVDFINTRVRDGQQIDEAILEAGRRRFRAVLLTSVTTVAGLIPLLMERSFQAQVLIPMATSLCFGLILATALVLILVPTMYHVYAKTVEWLNRKSQSLTATELANDTLPISPVPETREAIHP